jgi:hypothetical protein
VSTQRPPWTFSRAQLIEQADRVLASVAGEVAVVPVDHREAGAHVAGEVEAGDAGTPFARTQTGGSREDHHRSVTGPEPGGDGFELGP